MPDTLFASSTAPRPKVGFAPKLAESAPKSRPKVTWQNRFSGRMIGKLFGVLGTIVLLLAVLMFDHSNTTAEERHPTAQHVVPTGFVNAADGGETLVGQVARMPEEQDTIQAEVHAKPPTLTNDERKRLLQIIGSN